MNKKIWIGLVAMVVLLFFAYSAINKSTTDVSGLTDASLKLIKARGTLVVGSDIPYGVMEFYDESGKPVGFDVEIAQKIADKLGVKLEFRDYPFDDLFTLVQEGKIDMIASSITITEERQKKMLFSTPYFNGGQSLVTKLQNSDIKSINDVSDKKIGVQTDTTGNEFIKKYVEDKSIFPFNSSAEILEALKKNEIDAFMVDYIEATNLQKQNPSLLKIVGDPLTQEFYGVVTKLGNDSLMEEINSILKELNRSGQIDQLMSKWFK